MRRVETVRRLVLLLVLNLRSSLVWSFYFTKKKEYSWLIARIPFLIYSRSLPNKLPADSVWDEPPSSSLAEGFSSVTRGLIGWLRESYTNA
jgi:hypothetical protein